MTFSGMHNWLARVWAQLSCAPRAYAFARRAIVLAATMLTITSLAGAGSVQVPFSVQADLLAKVASFDRNFATRAGPRALVLVMQMPNDAESAAAAQELKTALSRIPLVGDRPHDEQ